MTSFEWLSIVAYYLQLLVIGGGLWMMREAGLRRDRQIDQQGKVLEDIAVGIREQSAGIREIVELSRAQRAEQSEQSAGIRALLERGQSS